MTSQNKWSDKDAKELIDKYLTKGFNEDLALRTYTARLLGSDPELVLHGGGNTSVKSSYTNLFNINEKILHVKGSGWDLATIEPEGHPAVKLEPLIKLRKLQKLSDEDMVAIQRQNLIDPNSPNPSVETLLHAFIPEKFIDHTHSIAMLALANQPNAMEVCTSLFGDRLGIVPYVMPGFDLAIGAINAYEITRQNLSQKGREIEGLILLNHGIFTFGNSAKISYERMINIVREANNFLKRKVNLKLKTKIDSTTINHDLISLLPYLRGMVGRKSFQYGSRKNLVFSIRNNENIKELLDNQKLMDLINRGVATPDHVIRTKAYPFFVKPLNSNKKYDVKSISDWINNLNIDLEKYIFEYKKYFKKNNTRVGGTKKELDPIPKLLIFPGIGLIGIGSSKKSADIVADIGETWIETVLSAESIKEFKPVSESDTFDLEYWSLEQAKLSNQRFNSFSGKIVLITGGAGVIGSQIAEDFRKLGAEIILLDISKDSLLKQKHHFGNEVTTFKCDLTNKIEIENVFKEILLNYGGIDIVISNAGVAFECSLENLSYELFQKSININLLSHHFISQEALKVFKAQDFKELNREKMLGGQLLYNISKQSINPGRNFGSYGIAKAGLLALMKQYALETADSNIRCNGVNADRIKSGLLNKELIKKRAISRGISEDEYMQGNLLKSEVFPKDVANAFVSLALMEKTTGGILTVDGGNVAAMLR